MTGPRLTFDTATPTARSTHVSTRYRRRPTPVLAVQWTGDNEAALRKFAAFRFAIIDDSEEVEDRDIDATARLLDDTRGDWVPLEPGDWVIRCRGRYTAVREADFAKDYELDGGAS